MQITGLTLQTSKLKGLASFYSELFGLPVTFTNNDNIVVSIGSTSLVFKQVSTANPFYHFAINIPANKIDEAKSWLTAHVELIWIEQY